MQKHTSIQIQGCYQQYLGLGLPPLFRSTQVFRFTAFTNIQGLRNQERFRCTSISILRGCYQYLEAYLYLGLGLLLVFRSTPVFRFRVATNISGIKEAIMIQKHTSIEVQGCYHLYFFGSPNAGGGTQKKYGFLMSLMFLKEIDFLVPRTPAEVHKKIQIFDFANVSQGN